MSKANGNHGQSKDKKALSIIKETVPAIAKRVKKRSLQQQTNEALRSLPRITNETVAEHREEVLKGARKFKYPLSHSKHKIIIISSILLALSMLIVLIVASIDLYKLQSTSGAVYRITKILPFPVAKVGKDYVAYENYLFDVRRYMYYYRTQQRVDFTSESGKIQLAAYKSRAMAKVIQDAYVKQLASKNKISVSSGEVNNAVDILRVQNRLTDNKELSSVLRRYYNWSIEDLKRSLKGELLAQKVSAKLDTAASAEASTVIEKIKNGEDFGYLAKQYSDDVSTKDNGGQYNDVAITAGSQEVTPVVVDKLMKMKPGETSGIILSSKSFEIVRLISIENGKYKAAHIQIDFRPITDFTNDLAKGTKVSYYIPIKPSK